MSNDTGQGRHDPPLPEMERKTGPMKIKDLFARVRRRLKKAVGRGFDRLTTGRLRTGAKSGYHSRWSAARRAMKKAGAWDGNPKSWYAACPACGALHHEGIKWMKEHPELVDAELVASISDT